MPGTYNVLFLCTGNSARSIMAEAVLNHKGKPHFAAYSAGSHPSGAVRREALAQVERAEIPIEGLRSKSWDEFAAPDSPPLDFVITVCDAAAGEVCPYWPGHPISAHWGIADPAAVQGTDVEKAFAFRQAFRSMETRIQLLLSLPITSIDRMRLKEHMDAIGKTPASSDAAH